jgi:hypothetical protein
MAETFLYLTTTGHKSGNPHRIEIWYVAYRDCYYLCAEHREQTHWVQNIQHDSRISFVITEREQPLPEHPGLATLIDDPEEQKAVAMLFEEKYNWSDGLLVRICSL